MTTARRDVSPVGRLFEIAHGDHRAVITESGATLRVYEVGPRPVVEAFDGADAPVIGSQGQILAPWPNRVVDGRWRWESTDHQLWVTEPERGHAVHGLVRTLPFSAVGSAPDRIELETVLLAHPGWPFPLHLDVSYVVGSEGLTCRLRATNIGRAPCPYGAGFHPYLAIPGGSVDDAVLELAAATWLATDGRMAPVERRPTAGTRYDFSAATRIAAREIDTAFTDLDRLANGRVEARLTFPDGRTTVMWGGSSVRWWQVFTGDDLPGTWRRRTVALEPMTCGPDALNTREDLVVLEPGDSHSMEWGITLVQR